MDIGIQEIAERRGTPLLTPAVREFLDGLAEIIARDILTYQKGGTDDRIEPDRATRRAPSSC